MLFLREHLKDVFGQMLINFPVSRNGLGDLGEGIVIPIMVASMTNKNTAKFPDLLHEIAVFHASSSSA